MGGFWATFKQFTHPHYLVNFALSICFYTVKVLPPICSTLFEDCELELREWELLTFLGCIVVMKNRKQPSFSMYVGTVCMFAKILGTFLFARQNPLLAVGFGLLCLLHLVFLPEPAYSGPDNVTYFKGHIQDEIERDKRVIWLIEFYAAWSPTCVNFAPTYAQLSAKYGLDNLKFGKVDVTRFNEVAKRYNIDTSSWSKQLPTITMFQGGKEYRRRPAVNSKGNLLAKFMFNEENVVRDFELNELYLRLKKNPIHKKAKDKKSDLNKADKEEAPPADAAAENGKVKSE